MKIHPLIYISSRVVVHSEHWQQSVRVAICSGNVGTSGTNTVNVEPDSAGHFRNHGTGFQRVVDAVDRVRLHRQQEARGALGARGAGVEQGRRRVRVVLLAHVLIGLKKAFKISQNQPIEIPT